MLCVFADDATRGATNSVQGTVDGARNTVNQVNSAVGRIPSAVDNGQSNVDSYVDSQIGKEPAGICLVLLKLMNEFAKLHTVAIILTSDTVVYYTPFKIQNLLCSVNFIISFQAVNKRP